MSSSTSLKYSNFQFHGKVFHVIFIKKDQDSSNPGQKIALDDLPILYLICDTTFINDYYIPYNNRALSLFYTEK